MKQRISNRTRLRIRSLLWTEAFTKAYIATQWRNRATFLKARLMKMPTDARRMYGMH